MTGDQGSESMISEPESEFITKLIVLGNKFIEILNKLEQSKKKFYYTLIEYIPKITFHENKTVKELRWQERPIKIPALQYYCQTESGAEAVIKQTKEFTISLDFLKQQYKNQTQPELILTSFCQKLFYQYPGSKDKLKEYVEILIKQLNNEPINLFAKVYVIGLEIDEYEINLLDGAAKIRTLNESDTKFQTDFHFSGQESLNFMNEFVIEIKIKATEPMQLQKEIETFVRLLRLYKVGALEIRRYKMNTEGVIKLSGGMVSYTLAQNLIKEPKLKFRSSEVENFEKFYLICRNIESVSWLTKIDSPFKIGLRRYEQALTMFGLSIERLTYAVMGLESLFLDNNREASNKLALRISKLLSIFDEDALEIFDEIKEAYELRSDHVHGKIFKPEENQRCDILLPNILDYLRKTLVISLMFENVGMTKETIIDTINKSLLSVEKYEELSKIAREKTEDIKFVLEAMQ